ncbi:hypothetical protein [uncultured Modestobacter sp.]|uniref:hypothetical protein n=1 Tax=uncultured Modestobacter sp. TaxID=380048 RepID=UPI00261943F3|nr:hypothetical protein [uncultured Modestobacter sp.]
MPEQPPSSPVPCPPPQPPSWPAAGWGPGAPGPGTAWPGPPPAPPAARPTGASPAAAAVRAGVLALGIVLAVVVGALVLRSGADDLGRGIGEGWAEASAAAVADASSGYPDPGWYDPVPEQSDPEAPDGLGDDPVLDGLAQQCFDGDLPACDDLYLEAVPGYREYGLTCAGRVEAYAVYSCAELG